MQVLSDGRFLVAGTVRGANGTNDFGVARFLPDGSLDSTFGTNGLVMTDFGQTAASVDELRAMTIDASGRILVAGFTNRGGTSGNDFAVARYLANGALDTSFAGSGKSVSNFGANDQANAIALQADGKIIVTSGRSFPDALAAGPLSAAFGRPILLVSDTLPMSTGRCLGTIHADEAVIVGSRASVPYKTEVLLEGLLPNAVSRIGGVNRYDTAAKVAEYGVRNGLRWDDFALASGLSFPDGLSAGAAQGHHGAVLILAPEVRYDEGSVDPAVTRVLLDHQACVNHYLIVGWRMMETPTWLYVDKPLNDPY
jgi:uncharacterized delta-60 repeat protein